MLQILGVGHAYPETILDTATISALGEETASDIEARSGIKQRRSSLPLDYLKTTKNRHPKEAKAQALCTPTDLSFAACEMALARAQIGWEQVGLIIGDGSTPHQTTPSEAQRVGNRANVKIPAYDSAALSGAFVFHVHTVNSWRAERTPDYVLCLSVNTPTKLVDYSASGDGRFYFGDAAGAILLSKRHPGRLSVKDSFFAPVSGELTTLRFEMDGHLRGEIGPEIARLTRDGVSLAQRALERTKSSSLAVVDAQLGNELSQGIAKGAALSGATFLSNFSRCGYSLGSSPIAALSEHWDSLNRFQELLVLSSGTGSGAGYLTLVSGGIT